MDIIQQIEQLYSGRGRQAQQGRPNALEHALQCAQLAEWAHADCDLVAAAFLHDLGGLLLPRLPRAWASATAVNYLSMSFGAGVTEPIRLQAEAAQSLLAQQKPCARWLRQPHASAALQLCRWDELAVRERRSTPGLGHYLKLLRTVQLPSGPVGREDRAQAHTLRQFGLQSA